MAEDFISTGVKHPLGAKQKKKIQFAQIIIWNNDTKYFLIRHEFFKISWMKVCKARKP